MLMPRFSRARRLALWCSALFAPWSGSASSPRPASGVVRVRTPSCAGTMRPAASGVRASGAPATGASSAARARAVSSAPGAPAALPAWAAPEPAERVGTGGTPGTGGRSDGGVVGTGGTPGTGGRSDGGAGDVALPGPADDHGHRRRASDGRGRRRRRGRRGRNRAVRGPVRARGLVRLESQLQLSPISGLGAAACYETTSPIGAADAAIASAAACRSTERRYP